MKPVFETINRAKNSSFLVRKFEEKSFAAPYHFHPEYELTLIVSGNGKRYVGTHMADFSSGDLLLLGANTPHCWKSEKGDPGEVSTSIVVHFLPGFLGADFFTRPELNGILTLLNNSNFGIQFYGKTEVVQQKLACLLMEHDSLKKLLLLLEILRALSLHKDVALLNKQNLFASLPATEKERMNAVLAYIVENFRDQISLPKAAKTANLTPQAFCKYFKKMTRKTFIEAVTDYRVDFALQELVHTGKPITQIGFDSGFNDSSNFYKTFKERLKMSPLHYRNTFINK